MTPTDTLIDHGAPGRAAPWTTIPNVEDYGGIDDLLRRGGLDWEIQLHPMQVAETPGAVVPVDPASWTRPVGMACPGQAVVRVNKPTPATGIVKPPTVLANVGSSYTPLQNRTIATILEGIMEDYPEVRWIHAGALRGGRDILFVAKMDGMSFRMENDQEDITDAFLIVWSNHTGRRAMHCFITSQRLHCTNQLRTMNPQRVAALRITHSGDPERKSRDFGEALRQETARFKRFAAWQQELAKIPATADDLKQVGEILFKAKRERAAWEDLRQQRLAMVQNNFRNERGDSLFHLLQAATEWVNHSAVYKAQDGWPEADQRAVSLLSSTGAGLQWKVAQGIDALAMQRGSRTSLTAAQEWEA